MVKSPCSEKLKGLCEEDESAKMATYGSKHYRTGSWTTFSKRSGQRRSGKSSREKWVSNQKEDSKNKSFTPQEEELVIQLHAAIGSRWPIIAQQLPGKTDNDVKILWNSKLRKKLSAMGIDPVTHKPFSQILADYGNIGAFPKARTRFSSLSRDLKNAIMFKSEQQPQTFPNSDHHFSSAVKTEPYDLYSQIQAVNLVTETTNYTQSENATPHFMNECASSSDSPSSAINQEISSFSWSDFLLEEAFLPPEIDGEKDKGIVLECDDRIDGLGSYGAVEDKNGFEVSSSSNCSSSFVEAMLERQDEMFPQIPGFYEEIFYY
ncbi:Transcription factor, Myb superfamily [Handroanthus impetiginosus]|uniref:Transcription factor, Myb superfamily n=1 Tax=Handroanthus impetiginosus TaxID=429701 RepID=A0A2G9G209_9LAMI|nr:Transcription factor, Myb superfamily [Handroanthus impetiginosus]